MRVNCQFLIEVTHTENHDRFIDAPQETRFNQCFEIHCCAIFKAFVQITKIHFLIINTEDIGETTFEGQAPHEWKLTAFKVGTLSQTTTRMLTFNTTTSISTAASRLTAPDAGSFLG